MLPNLNFNPSFANLAALHNLGGMPHPAGPMGPITSGYPTLGSPQSLGGGAPTVGYPPMPGPMPAYSGMPAQTTMPMQAGMPGQMPGMPQGNLNLQALMHLLGRPPMMAQGAL